jgi:hypothetical protein
MAGVQMGRADLEPVAVGWERSRRRCVCPRCYGQTNRGRGRTDEDARKRGRAFHDEWCSCYLTICYSAICYSTIGYSTICYSTIGYSTIGYSTIGYSNIGIPDQPSLLGFRYWLFVYSAIVSSLSGHTFSCNGKQAHPIPASSVFRRSVLHESWFAKRVRNGSRGRKLSLARYDNLCRTAIGIQLRESGVAGCSPQNKIMQQNHA